MARASAPRGELPAARSRRRVIAGAIAYWTLVLVVSLVVAVGVIAFLISRDAASLDAPGETTPATTAPPGR